MIIISFNDFRVLLENENIDIEVLKLISDLIGADPHTRLHTMINTLDHSGTADTVLYIDAAGEVQELGLGAGGNYLKSQGAGSAPIWATPPGDFSFKTITGITNDLIADSATDILTLTTANNLLGIVGTTLTDTITFTINEANFILDGNTLQLDGINSDGGAFAFATTGSIGIDMVNAGATIFSITNSGAGVASLDVTGNIIVSGTVDTVDIAALKVIVDNLVEDDVYSAGWNGDTTHAPSQNAVYDKIEDVLGSGYATAQHNRQLEPTHVIPEHIGTAGVNNVYWSELKIKHGKTSFTAGKSFGTYFNIPNDYVDGEDIIFHIKYRINNANNVMDYQIIGIRYNEDIVVGIINSTAQFTANAVANMMNFESITITGTDIVRGDIIRIAFYIEDNNNNLVTEIYSNYLVIPVNSRD